MKAIICTKYGSPDVLQLREVAKPAPKEALVLIRIHAASKDIISAKELIEAGKIKAIIDRCFSLK